ncbi:glycosyltransferase [Nocardioides panacihumi]
MSKLLDPSQAVVEVFSRPEPVVKTVLDRVRARPRANDLTGVEYVDPVTLRLPALNDRFRWWDDSLRCFPERAREADGRPVVVWNPMLGRSSWWPRLSASAAHVHLDLLDDWTVHYAFRNLRAEVEESYGRMFASAATITANSEGTLALAQRFGRSDARLLPNGVDPERFDLQSRASGPFTVGYVGKIGERLDLELIADAARTNPAVRFVFAGPVLDGEFRSFHQTFPNIEWLGDVHYEDMPDLLRSFDVGWVPHRVGAGEVGGDVIKTYEYRAAGLPVLSTPIIGIGDRGFSAVTVLPSSEHAGWLKDASRLEDRAQRVPEDFPQDVTWRWKTAEVLRAVGLPV